MKKTIAVAAADSVGLIRQRLSASFDTAPGWVQLSVGEPVTPPGLGGVDTVLARQLGCPW